MSEVIRVNFGKPMPVFPLPETILLPHSVQPLHIFEPRYRQMIRNSLDASGQFAMATFEGDVSADEYEYALPPLRPAVCVGQIGKHRELPDGRYLLDVHGICRARILRMLEPDEVREYRCAMIEPLEQVEQPPEPMPEVRASLHDLLSSRQLSHLRNVDVVCEWFDHEDVSTHALLELIGFALVRDHEVKYRLLAEADVMKRAGLITDQLIDMARLLGTAEQQSFRDWPKGMSWN
jgi:Lon protease-like protein